MRLIGDLNDDGVLNAADLYILQQYIGGYPISQISPLTEDEFLLRADVNLDGVVNSLDVTTLEYLIPSAPNVWDSITPIIALGLLAGMVLPMMKESKK